MGCGTMLNAISRGVLVFTNTIFILLGLFLIVLGIYLKKNEWHEFLDTSLSDGVTAGGFLMLVIACFGYCGARNQQKRFLIPYTVVVIATLAAQVGISVSIYKFQRALVAAEEHGFGEGLKPSEKAVAQWIERQFNEVYDRCEPSSSYLYKTAPSKYKFHLECNNSEYDWFGKFCTASCHISPKQLQDGSGFHKCAGDNPDLGHPTVKTVFCACDTAIADAIGTNALDVCTVAAIVGGFEVVLVALSCYLMCCRTRRYRRYLPLQRNLYQPHGRGGHPPTQQYGGQYTTGSGGGVYYQPVPGGGGYPNNNSQPNPVVGQMDYGTGYGPDGGRPHYGSTGTGGAYPAPVQAVPYQPSAPPPPAGKV